MSSGLPFKLRGSFERREYQVKVFEEVRDWNSLVVLPTGLGKTIIGVFLIAEKMEEKAGPCFFLAPTRPLCEQHLDTLKKHLDAEARLITGETHKPGEREKAWSTSVDVFVATPHTVRNDLQTHRLGLEECPLIVFDEAHRTVGNYPYVDIAETYFDTAEKPQVLGLTASPGEDFDRLVEIAMNLKLERVSVRTDRSEDVEPYLGSMNIRKATLKKPELVVGMENLVDKMLRNFLEKITNYSNKSKNLTPDKLSISDLKEVQKEFQRRLKAKGSGYLYHAISVTAALMKLVHFKRLVTTQGIEIASRFVEKLPEDDSKASSLILNHNLFNRMRKGFEYGKNSRNPKLEKVRQILEKHFEEKKEGKALVFTEYRDTLDFLKKNLENLPKIRVETFLGQAGKKGMSQKEQKETLVKFGNGKINTLISTSIGEEGIDIPSTSLVIFYEPVPSAIRRIQRKGRTARNGREGQIYVLVMKGTSDEAFHWKSRKGEGRMYGKVNRLKEILEKNPDPVQKLHSLKKCEQADLNRWNN